MVGLTPARFAVELSAPRRVHLGACILIAATIGTDLAGLPLLIQNRFRLYRGE
jgi:hypothetical protein